MNENANDNPSEPTRIPASLQRSKKEPTKSIQLRLPVSWCEELTALAREYDQDVTTFLREATEDWLLRARKVRQSGTSEPGR